MNLKVQRYCQLKMKQKELEQELALLRDDIISYCEREGIDELSAGDCSVKLVVQQRREYDDGKLYAALPDPGLWRMLSRADAAKIGALLKLNVIDEPALRDTYTLKRITLLHIG